MTIRQASKGMVLMILSSIRYGRLEQSARYSDGWVRGFEEVLLERFQHGKARPLHALKSELPDRSADFVS